jgi:phospholipid/cholesterol/gamma-HCH transport system permease protein
MFDAIIQGLAALGDYTRLTAQTLYISIRRPPQWPLIRDQLCEIGVLSLPVVAFTGFSTGLVLAHKPTFNYLT